MFELVNVRWYTDDNRMYTDANYKIFVFVDENDGGDDDDVEREFLYITYVPYEFLNIT